MNTPHYWNRVTVTKEARRDAIDVDGWVRDVAKRHLADKLMELMDVQIEWKTYREIMEDSGGLPIPPPVGADLVADDWVATTTTRLKGFDWPSEDQLADWNWPGPLPGEDELQ